jgi:hypothetical protein
MLECTSFTIILQPPQCHISFSFIDSYFKRNSTFCIWKIFIEDRIKGTIIQMKFINCKKWKSHSLYKKFETPPHPTHVLPQLVLIILSNFHGQPMSPLHVVIYVGGRLIQQLGELLVEFWLIYLVASLAELLHYHPLLVWGLTTTYCFPLTSCWLLPYHDQ